MPERKQVRIKVLVHDNKDKSKAMKTVSSLSGMEQMKVKKLTLIGDIDSPINVIRKLNNGHSEIVTVVGPMKEVEKKKKPEDNKHEGIYCIQPLEDKKREEEKKNLEAMRWMAIFRPINTYMRQQYYAHNVEDYPKNSCVIC